MIRTLFCWSLISSLCCCVLTGCRLPGQDKDYDEIEIREVTHSNSAAEEQDSATAYPVSTSGHQRIIQVGGVSPNSGPIRIAIFTETDTFPDHATATQKLSFAQTDQPTVEIQADVPEGPVAVAVFQDLNNDGILNRSGFGIPSEPYGFSNDARGQMGPPSFAAARIAASDAPITVTLSKLSF